MKLLSFIIISSALVLLSACVNLKPSPDRTRHFVLGPDNAVPVESSGLTEVALQIYIMRPQLPGYLESTRLHYRDGGGEIKTVPNARWSETLPEGIARAFGQYLDQSAAIEVIGHYPWPRPNKDSARLTLRFDRLLALGSGEFQVVLRWTLRRPGEADREGRYISQTLDWNPEAGGSLVGAMNMALKEAASDVSETLMDISGPTD